MKFQRSLVLAFLLIQVLSGAGCGGGEPLLNENKDTSSSAVLEAILDQTTIIMGKVTDGESANLALPQLIKLNGELVALVNTVGNLSPEERQRLSEIAARAMPDLKDGARYFNARKDMKPGFGMELSRIVFKLSELL